MRDPTQQTDRREARVQRVAQEAVRAARGHDGWDAYEAAKAYVRREHGANVPGYNAIIDRIKDRLDI